VFAERPNAMLEEWRAPGFAFLLVKVAKLSPTESFWPAV
jgi:hypothetical protein